jgi:hypothetical protein
VFIDGAGLISLVELNLKFGADAPNVAASDGAAGSQITCRMATPAITRLCQLL